MPMKDPPHPGLGLRDDIEVLGLSVAEAAAGIGVTRQQLYNVLSGKHAITPEMALRLEMAIGGTADSWLAMQAAYDLAQLRNRNTIVLRRLGPKVA
jgi:antitoxin HigA-1